MTDEGLEVMPRVLLVEDDMFTARCLRRLLTARGVCHVLHATTVAEALRLLDPPPTWVILDLHLPDGSGLRVLEAIRSADLSTRVVVSSATNDANLTAMLADYQPDVIIPKPMNPALLPIGLQNEC